jgi:hypothetical protein
MTAHQEQEHRMAYEFTVANAMGPLLRAAFPEHHVEAVDPCTVIHLRIHPDQNVDLVDLVGLFESAGVIVQDLYRISR